jgi:hypothetical protein
MAHVRYFVIPHADHWLVTMEGRPMAHVTTRNEAINSAIVMADLMGNMGHDADVMLDEAEKLTLIWTYGKDAFEGSHPRKVTPPPRPPTNSHVKLVELGASR